MRLSENLTYAVNPSQIFQEYPSSQFWSFNFIYSFETPNNIGLNVELMVREGSAGPSFNFFYFFKREFKVRGTHKGVTSYVCSVVKKKREAIDKMTGNHKNQYN